MPPRRYRKRKTTKPRRVRKGKKNPVGPIHKFTQIIDGDEITGNASSYVTQSTTVDEFNSWYFALNDCDQVLTFKDLFEEYRIDKVMLELRPSINFVGSMWNSTQTVSGSPPKYNLSYLVKDWNDAVSENISAMRQHENCRVISNAGGGIVRVTVNKPAFNAGIKNTSGATVYAKHETGWISTTNEAVPHYGIKMLTEFVSDAINSSYVQNWRVTAKYFISFRGTK